MTTPNVWVEGPYELIQPERCGLRPGVELGPARRMAQEMIIVHNAILRGGNAVYRQCVNVSQRGTTQDKLDFAHFALQWANMIHEHHTAEETFIFPDMEEVTGEKGLMDVNVAEHAAFHEGTERFSGYLRAVVEGKEEYDGEKLKAIMDSYMPLFREHLDHEIDTLNALERFDDKVDWLAWFNKKVEAMAGKLMADAKYRREMFPITFIFHDKTFAGGVWPDFPPIPWYVALMLRWLYCGTHKNWWRFAGCDMYSQPKELPFA